MQRLTANDDHNSPKFTNDVFKGHVCDS